MGGLQIAVGTVAVGSLGIIVEPSPWRDGMILALWPIVIIAGTVIAWRWLGRLERGEGWMALTEVIESGRELRRKLAEEVTADPPPPEDAESLWGVRVKDWVDQARSVVGSTVPERLGAFATDVLWVGMPAQRGNRPSWAVGHLTELDMVTERLVMIRASL